MKKLILKNSLTGWRTRRALQNLVLLALCLTAASAFAATEQWLGVPGTTATTNWTDGANWTSAQQTYYNEVQFTTAGTSANTDFSINNVLDATTGVAQMPIWQLDYIPLNGNYTTLINPGVTLQVAAGNGTLYVGADSLNNGSPAAANAVETITMTGAGGALSIAGGLYLGQGSTLPGDTHNVTLDLSGLDNFTDNSGNNLYVASGGLQRGNGVFYLAKTNSITLNTFQICNQNYSNSVPSAAYLGIVNNVGLGGGNLIVGGNGAVTGAALKFNPAVVGGATVPAAYFYGTGSSGRIPNVLIGSGNGGAQVASTGVVDFSGGNIYMVADAMQIGQAGSSMASGTLTFDNNTIDANNVTVGNQTGTGAGIGVVNLNNNPTLSSSAWLLVRQTLTLAASAGAVTPGTAGTVNVNGSSLSANTIVNGGGNGTINLNNSTLTLGGTAGTTTAPISNWNTTNSTLTLPVLAGTNSTIASLKTGGATNIINISTAPPYPSYPVQVVLVKYASLGGAGFNFGIGSLPALYAGHLVNNTANGSIDIVFTAGSSTLTWNGNVSGNWDTTTANWLAGSAATYADGQVVQFFDGASSSTVNLTATFSPSSIIVSNNSQAYTFNGSGALSGSTPFFKSGSGTLIIDNSGNNNFTGGFGISNGTVQIGNNDTSGNLPAGAIVNNGNLIFARSDSSTINNNISGSGAVVQNGGTLLLSGNNSYTGSTLVTNGGKLQVGSGSALGGGSSSTIVASGSTLDINGNYESKPIIVSGNGVDGNGAIVNSGGGVYGLVSQITLTGDTTFGYGGRWDLVNTTLNTGGQAYNLTINAPTSYFEWNNLTVDSALANISFPSGSWGWKYLTSLGNPAGTLTVGASSTITIYNTSTVNKAVDFQGGLLVAYSANNVMSGTMTLEDGYNSFQMGGGCSLTLSNTLSGTANATLYVSGGTGTLTLAGNSPSYLGNVYLNQGVVVLDGSIGGTVTTRANATFAGHGSASGLVDINSTFYPGNSGVVGTFTAAGGLTLEGSANLTMDLSSSLSSSSNDLVQVNGDLTMNGNNISINPISGTLANGTYPLINYTGNFNGSIGTAATVYSTAYTLVLTNNTTAKQIQVIVSGTLNPSLLVWNNANGNSQWDIGSSPNWSNSTTHASSSVFNTLDTVVLDDSILTAANPSTNIVVAATVVPAAITNNSSASYTLSGAGKLSGSGSLVKQGSGTLGLNVAGNFTGPVSIQGGTLQTIGNNTLGSVASITVTNSGTFDFAGQGYNSTNPIIISGTGVNGVGAIYNSAGGIYGEILNIVLANDALIAQDGHGRYDLATGSQISGAHNLTINFNGDYGEWNAVNIGTNVSGITLTNGNIGMKTMDTAFQNPATVFTASTNCQLTFWNGGFNGSLNLLGGSSVTVYSGPPTWNFTGNTITFADGVTWLTYGNSGNELINSAITLNGVAHFRLGDHNLLLTNVLSGPGGFLMEYWNHQMILTASNTYTGPTIINQGGNSLSVALSGNGSISHSSLIFFGGSDPTSLRMDVSGRTDQTFTLASGQTLAGVGAVNGSLVVSAGATVSPAGTNTTIGVTAGANTTGIIGVSSNIVLNGTTVMKLNGSGVNDSLQTPAGSITYGGALTVVNLSSTPLAAGNSFQLFSAHSYLGTFSSTNLPALNAGLAWDLSQLNIGFVNVIATGGSGPTIGNTTISGNQLIFSGTGGTAGNSYAVLTSTNLTSANWTAVATNTFGAGGTFSVTNTISSGNPQQFYRIKLLP